MTVEEIVKKYLKENGYDGLCCPGECGCVIDDLFPCGNDSAICGECKPAHRVDCKAEDCETMSCECGGFDGYNYRMEAEADA